MCSGWLFAPHARTCVRAYRGRGAGVWVRERASAHLPPPQRMHVRTDARMGCAVREYAMCAWVGASAPVPPPPQQRTHCGLHRDATTWPTARPRSHAHAQREPAAGCVAWRLYIKKSTSADKLTWWWWWVVMVSVARGAMGARNGRPRWTPVPPSHAFSACPGRINTAYMCVPPTHRAAAHGAPLRRCVQQRQLACLSAACC